MGVKLLDLANQFRSFSAPAMSNSFSPKTFRPGIVESQMRRTADAHDRSRPLLEVISTMPGAPIRDMVRALNSAGHRAARGGPVTHNTVARALARMGEEAPKPPRHRAPKGAKAAKTIRARAEQYEVFRTPAYAYLPLLDYRPEWFVGRGCDPSAGDGRMLREIISRGNMGPHWASDIRDEEAAKLADIGQVAVADYLTMDDPPRSDFLLTNPPFTLAQEFVERAKTHVSGPICILQSIGWQTTQRRAKWLRTAGLAHVLNLPKRPQWEVDSGGKIKSNVWDYAWFVFLPNHDGRPQMDWLSDN